MPLSIAALAMSTRSERPRIVACALGASSRTAASAASTVAWRDAPIAQPTQFSNVRCASRSTPASQPRDGCVATKAASMRVTGGAFRSAGAGLFCAIARSTSIDDRDVAFLRYARPLGDIVTNVGGEFGGGHRHRLQGLAGESFAQFRI